MRFHAASPRGGGLKVPGVWGFVPLFAEGPLWSSVTSAEGALGRGRAPCGSPLPDATAADHLLLCQVLQQDQPKTRPHIATLLRRPDPSCLHPPPPREGSLCDPSRWPRLSELFSSSTRRRHRHA